MALKIDGIEIEDSIIGPAATGSSAGLMSPTDKTKVDSVQSGATANSTDAQLRDRSTHTGTQLASTISNFNAAVSSIAPVSSVAGKIGDVSLDKNDVGLNNVDNTSDLFKPVSTAQQTAINNAENNAKSYADTKVADLVASAPGTLDTLNELAAALGNDPNFASSISTALGNRLRVDIDNQGLSGTQKTNAKTNIDLQNVDNTSDLNKPISTAQQSALDLKYDASNPNGYETPTQLNNRDTNNRNRDNHTGTQLASTISDFNESAQDASSSMITNGIHDGISPSYDDVNNRLSFSNTDKGSTAVTTHEAAVDPHPQYTTVSEAAAAAPVQSVFGRTGVVVKQAGDYNASDITNTPAGNISSLNIQAAINELDTEKQPVGNYITALTGDVTASGPGSATATLANSGVTAGSYKQATLTVDAKGRVTAASAGLITVTMGANETRTQTSFAQITGLTSGSLPIGIYRITIHGLYQTAATTTGIGFRLASGPNPNGATLTTISMRWDIAQAADGTDQDFQYKQTATGINIKSASVVAANTTYAFSAMGIFRVTTAGTIAIEFASEVNNSQVTALADTTMILEVL